MGLQAKDWLPAVIGLAGGLLAGLIAAMSAVIGKENKISEFRQAWIDAQRTDLATMIAEAVAHPLEMDIAKKTARLASFDAAHARIELRENPKKPEWSAVRSNLDSLRLEMLKEVPDAQAVQKKRTEILEAARPPLKANWSIVKEGEPWFRRFKNAIIVAIITAVTLGVTAALWLGPTGPYMRPPAAGATRTPLGPPSAAASGKKAPAAESGKPVNGR